MTFGLFGEKKFGEFQFGAGEIKRPLFALEVDWDNDLFFDGQNDGLLMNSLRVRRGKRYVIRPNGDGFEEDETGKMVVTLLDVNNKYDPFVNTNIGAGKYFRLKVHTPGDQFMPLIAGKLNEPVIDEGRGIRRVQLIGEDGWNTLRDQNNRVNIKLQENIHGDEAMNFLLDTIGWTNLWGRELDRGVDLRRYWFADRKSAASALHDLAFSEMGKLFIAADGKLTFHNRHHIHTSAFTISDEDVFLGSLKVIEPWDVVRNSIRVTAKQREIQPTVELWRAIESIRLTPGEKRDDIFANYTFNGEDVLGTNIVQPVAGVDYLANTNADGTGVDITSDFEVSAYPFSTAAKMSIKHSGSLAGYLTLNRLRGDALTTNRETSEFNDSASQNIYQIRSLDIDYEWIGNIHAARAIARHLKDKLAFPRKHIGFQMRNNPEKQFALDLGVQVDVDIASRGISGIFKVYYLEHQWSDAAGMVTRTDVMLEPVEESGDYWVVPSQIPMRVPF
jgi:hypothetical protein